MRVTCIRKSVQTGIVRIVGVRRPVRIDGNIVGFVGVGQIVILSVETCSTECLGWAKLNLHGTPPCELIALKDCLSTPKGNRLQHTSRGCELDSAGATLLGVTETDVKTENKLRGPLMMPRPHGTESASRSGQSVGCGRMPSTTDNASLTRSRPRSGPRPTPKPRPSTSRQIHCERQRLRKQGKIFREIEPEDLLKFGLTPSSSGGCRCWPRLRTLMKFALEIGGESFGLLAIGTLNAPRVA